MNIFFGSSSKYLDNAQRIADRISNDPVKVFGWWDRQLFPPGRTTIESIERIPNRVDAALLFLTPDDEIIRREQSVLAARDNVIFEAGFFMSQFGRMRTVIARVGDVDIPTDLLGITYISLRSGATDQVIADNARVVNEWALSLDPLESSASEYLCQMARAALGLSDTHGRAANRLEAPDEFNSLRFPLSAYPFFLNGLLDQQQLKLTAIEAVGQQQVASFMALEEFGWLGLTPVDHRSLHWYLWDACPPTSLIDVNKQKILKKTAGNAGVTRFMCVAPPDTLPELLFRAIYFYALRFVDSTPKARLYFVLDENIANGLNQMHIYIRNTWFVAKRSEENGSRMVEILRFDGIPGLPFDSAAICEASVFTQRHSERYNRT